MNLRRTTNPEPSQLKEAYFRQIFRCVEKGFKKDDIDVAKHILKIRNEQISIPSLKKTLEQLNKQEETLEELENAYRLIRVVARIMDFEVEKVKIRHRNRKQGKWFGSDLLKVDREDEPDEIYQGENGRTGYSRNNWEYLSTSKHASKCHYVNCDQIYDIMVATLKHINAPPSETVMNVAEFVNYFKKVAAEGRSKIVAAEQGTSETVSNERPVLAERKPLLSEPAVRKRKLPKAHDPNQFKKVP
ncbi:unnamed protein product [Cylicocyclus nassatus]|uniref:Uncharacterized protein n=1 Tax=Cylicocyclus nassatus TaxID=53992 RepID=A0AA36DJ56_CYLNA|nr:unnamed protein product [Cylicocyclus nassatus]